MVRLVLIVRYGSELTDAAPVTHSFEYISFPYPFDSVPLLTNIEYWWKEIQFEQRFCVRHHDALFFNCYCVDIFGIPTREREKFFVRLPLWWSDCEGSCLLVASTPKVLAYHFTLALCAERHRLFFSVVFAEHCVSALQSFFLSAVVGGPVEYFHTFEGATAVAESGVLFF